MSHQLGRAVSVILYRYFGEIVQKVGDNLFTYGSKPIALIAKSTGLPRSQVVESLRTLLKFDLAAFEPSSNDSIADYKLLPDNVLLLIRYPRYLLQIKSKYGTDAEILIEELLQQATSTSTVLIVTVANKYKDDKEKDINVIKLKDTFISLVTAAYIQQTPVAELPEGSEVPTLVPVATIVPELDARGLIQASEGNVSEITDKIYWRVNYDRFHQDFRDEIMIKAVTGRIDENGSPYDESLRSKLDVNFIKSAGSGIAGELLRIMLQQMYVCSPAWVAVSNPIPALELHDASRRLPDKPLLQQHLDQYLKVLEENGSGFIRKTDDAAGGQYVVQTKRAVEQLLYCAIDHTVTERLGSKAARIYRLIRTRKYIEEDDIQKNAMLPNKLCKELTYKLLEENFISLQPMRKAASSGGMAKAIYLYHIKIHDVAQTVQEMCYRALHNAVSFGRHTRASHARLLDKQRRVRSIVHGMRQRHEPLHHITDVEETLTPPEQAVLLGVEKQLKQLSAAELELDRNLFILTWYFNMYAK